MLRPLQESDVERLSQLWLHLACSNHPSLPVRFWMAQARALRRELSAKCRSRTASSECTGGSSHWVYTRPGSDIAEGLVTISDNLRVETIFVSPGEQRRGVGSELMAQAKFGRIQLEARVLEENLHGRYFLQQHGFSETGRSYNKAANQDEIQMNCRVA
ncbi:GNAT family N-acetyltransferase [Microbulbifer sp. CAU 1566]|uniref:GNAT family N-acetyltransferase n=1 Tax=Microbulbifer sp. CAU 1566 TaxID=2933269 RepID=UPI0020049D87|nr:GNAT family N-acetyltransferase [Microbulbifer sp. CAU 1566]MCK7598064.1 GNAT family N-acetyltransferase [Microbulbifer sp. CAU 1566]